MKWISVYDRMPELTEEQKTRLIRDFDGFMILENVDDDNDYCIAYYDCDRGRCIVASKTFKPARNGEDGFTHWMLLPKPPKQK